jgi:hypothetical protein
MVGGVGKTHTEDKCSGSDILDVLGKQEITIKEWQEAQQVWISTDQNLTGKRGRSFICWTSEKKESCPLSS